MFALSKPARLRQIDWQKDEYLKQALLASWRVQYAEYLGEERATTLLNALVLSDEIYAHDPGSTIVATIGGMNVGVAALRTYPKMSLVTMLEVLPEYQGRGIGRQMVNALVSCGDPLLVHASIHRPKVRQFYQSLGFKLLERSDVDHYGQNLLFEVLVLPVTEPGS